MNFITQATPGPAAPAPGTNLLEKLTKEIYTNLKYMWILPGWSRTLPTLKTQMYVSSVSSFLDRVIPEQYPGTYEDTITIGNQAYFISYIFTSGTYLEDLASEAPATKIGLDTRSIQTQEGLKTFCLVRPWSHKWTPARLEALGAKELHTV